MRDRLAEPDTPSRPRKLMLTAADGPTVVLGREDLRAWPHSGRNLLGFAWIGLILSLLCTSHYLHAPMLAGRWQAAACRAAGFGLLSITLVLAGWSCRYHAAGSLARAMVHFIVTLSLLALACLTFSDPLY
jgi:hypothetical protein